MTPLLTTRYTRQSLYLACAAAGLTASTTAWLAGVRPKSVYLWAQRHGVSFRRVKP